MVASSSSSNDISSIAFPSRNIRFNRVKFTPLPPGGFFSPQEGV
ncbi:MAG: hypothetical protein AAGE96_24115 [Cyanobacteria bacterium P01_G01_bin.19]